MELVWYENYFDQTYHRFWVTLTPERAQKEVEALINFLDLKPGQSILDVPCGEGRIAIPLAEKGMKVTAMDISDYMLNLVRDSNQDINIVKGNMKHIPFSNEFDAVISIFHPLGMLETKEDDIEFLNSIYNSLKIGGKFIVESGHRDCIVRASNEDQYWEYDGTVVLESWKFDPLSSIRKGVLKWLENGEWKEKHSVSRYYTATNLIEMLESCGFKVKHIYEDFDGNDFSIESRDIILIAEK
jgi:ubiquinone/menaquinone biosynthesis C-methylase UbiE